MYRFIRGALFLLDAERAHYVAMNVLKGLCAIPFIRAVLKSYFSFSNPSLHQKVFGLHIKNPVGLGAGFDKNALYLRELETLGFGFIEIGTVTPKPQDGNAKPRLFRIKKDAALINRMGFNNDGVTVIADRLKKWRNTKEKSEMKMGNKTNPDQPSSFLIGGNIGKNKNTPNEDAWNDYATCFTALHPYVDFFVVNVSSPNTPGLRALQEKEALTKILSHLQKLNKTFEKSRPILLKISPDLSVEALDDVIDLAMAIQLDGLVATNTTIDRTGMQSSTDHIGAGGLSGKPLQHNATDIIKHIRQKTAGTIPIIGSGGIFTGKDAEEKIMAGAQLIEVWTGFIYQGPAIVQNICKHLCQGKGEKNK